MKRILTLSVIVFSLFISLQYLSAASAKSNKRIYVALFEVKGIDKSIADEVRDFMSESLVEEFSLISDDEVRVFINNAERNMLLKGDENSMSRLASAIKTDYLIYGYVQANSDGMYISASLMENGDIVNVGDIAYLKREYTDRAARALAAYIVMPKGSIGGFFGKKDPRESFKEDIKKFEQNMAKVETSYQKSSDSIKKSSVWRDESLIKSPVVRVGMSGPGMFSTFDKNTNKLYDSSFLLMGDLIFYRYKDPVGDGVDLYTRGTFRFFRGADSYARNIKLYPAGLDDDYFGMYDSMPISAPKLYVLSGDIGARFVGSTYILRSAVSFYFGGGIRFNSALRYSKYTAYESTRETFYQIGGIGIAGIEFSLLPELGLFTEVNAGYVPMGDDRINLEGPQIIAGITFRTKHFE